MIILDENILDGQRQLLEASGFAVRQIGHDFLLRGLKDEQVIVHLRAFRRSTFVTRDGGFFRKGLCHRGYCVAVVSANQYELTAFTRRFLRHPNFNTQAKRSGEGRKNRSNGDCFLDHVPPLRSEGTVGSS